MDSIHRITKNFSWLFVAQIFALFTGLIQTVILTRYLGNSEYGKYGIALSIAIILLPLIDGGLSTLTIREVSRKHDLAAKYLDNIMVIRTCYTVITASVMLLLVHLGQYPADRVMAIYFLVGMTVLSNFTQLFKSIFRAKEAMEYEAALSIIRSTTSLLTAGIIVWMQHGLIYFTFLQMLTELFVLIIAAAICKAKFVAPGIQFDFAFWKETIVKGIPFLLSFAIGCLYFRIDILILAIYCSSGTVGVYTAITNLQVYLFVFGDIFISALYPAMARFFVSSKDNLNFLIEKAVKIFIMVGMPIAMR